MWEGSTQSLAKFNDIFFQNPENLKQAIDTTWRYHKKADPLPENCPGLESTEAFQALCSLMTLLHKSHTRVLNNTFLIVRPFEVDDTAIDFMRPHLFSLDFTSAPEWYQQMLPAILPVMHEQRSKIAQIFCIDEFLFVSSLCLAMQKPGMCLEGFSSFFVPPEKNDDAYWITLLNNTADSKKFYELFECFRLSCCLKEGQERFLQLALSNFSHIFKPVLITEDKKYGVQFIAHWANRLHFFRKNYTRVRPLVAEIIAQHLPEINEYYPELATKIHNLRDMSEQGITILDESKRRRLSP